MSTITAPTKDTHNVPALQRRTASADIALIIAAHNEEAVITKTITSAIAAGMGKQHIYVVDDNSSDNTSDVARNLLSRRNVIKVGRSGKGLAINKGVEHFGLTNRYQWIHIADADGGFAKNYFNILRLKLDPRYAAATGYITSSPGSIVGDYRVMEYTMGMEVVRRFQTFGRVVSVIPGPSSCFRADVFKKLNFTNGALTEDFCVTLQIHRQKLGPIQFIEEAEVFTQDPQNFRDFMRQIKRWNLGVLQGIQLYKIGLRPQRIDAYLGYAVAQNLMMFFLYAFWIPYVAISQQSVGHIAIAFVVDILVMAILAFLAARRAKRWDILISFPNIYALRWVNLGVFLWAYVQMFILRRYRIKNSSGIWQPVTRKATV